MSRRRRDRTGTTATPSSRRRVDRMTSKTPGATGAAVRARISGPRGRGSAPRGRTAASATCAEYSGGATPAAGRARHRGPARRARAPTRRRRRAARAARAARPRTSGASGPRDMLRGSRAPVWFDFLCFAFPHAIDAPFPLCLFYMAESDLHADGAKPPRHRADRSSIATREQTCLKLSRHQASVSSSAAGATRQSFMFAAW